MNTPSASIANVTSTLSLTRFSKNSVKFADVVGQGRAPLSRSNSTSFMNSVSRG
jgi:hypothetical protein